MTKRQKARWEQERSKQRRVVILVSAVIGIAVALIGLGLFIDKVITPNQTMAEVAGQEISNSEYQLYRKITQAQRAVSYASQAIQFQQFQQQGGDQFTPQIQADIAALKLKTAPLDYQILDQLISDKVISKAAADEGLSITDEELQRGLATRFEASIRQTQAELDLATPTAAISDTGDISGTNGLSDTADLTPTPTPSPTETPTLEATVSQVDVAIRNYYDTVGEFLETNTQYGNVLIPFTYEEFKQYVIEQERLQLLRAKIGEKLVTEDQAIKELYVDADTIFVRVVVGLTDTMEISETQWTEGFAKINTIATQLNAGVDFEKLQAEKSELLPESGWPEGLRPLTEYAAFNVTEPISTQPIGVIGEPFRALDGYHILRVTQREMKANQSDLEQKRGEAIVKWIEDKKVELKVIRYPEPTATPAPPTIDPALLPPTETPTPERLEPEATPTP